MPSIYDNLLTFNQVEGITSIVLASHTLEDCMTAEFVNVILLNLEMEVTALAEDAVFHPES